MPTHTKNNNAGIGSIAFPTLPTLGYAQLLDSLGGPRLEDKVNVCINNFNPSWGEWRGLEELPFGLPSQV